MSSTCPVCGAEQPEALLCHSCTTALERELGDVPSIVADLDIMLSKQARIGNGGAAGLARERSPINVGAMDPGWVLTNVLTTWTRDVAEVVGFLAEHSTSPSRAAARILLNHIPEIRRHPAVNELFDEITDAIKQARRVVDRPADRIYLGQCLVETPDDDGRAVTCLEEIYARPGANEVRCKVCLHDHPVAERRAWLLQRASDMLFTVKEASEMLGEIGRITVTQASIRGYIHRGKIGYRAGNTIRLGDLLAVVVDDGERKSA